MVKVACIGFRKLAAELLKPVRGSEDLPADSSVLESNALPPA
jgi:hypothetical protein